MKKFSEDYRIRVLEYIESPTKQLKTVMIKKATKLFKVSRRTIYNWFEIREKRGNLKAKKIEWKARKIDDKKLAEYVKNHPDKYLRELAVYFNVATMTVQRRLIKMGISRKKKRNVTKKEIQKK